MARSVSSTAGVIRNDSAGTFGTCEYGERPLQMIRREREPGSRRDVYVVDDDAWHGMMVRRDHLYAPLLRALDTALERHRPDDPTYHRIRLSAEFLRYVDEEMGKAADGWAARKRQLEGG